MFNSSKKEEVPNIRPTSQASPSTVIARGVKVEGDFNSEGDVVIEGEVKGALKTKASLTVGGESVITADIQAGTAAVSGTIEGNITVNSQLVVKSTATIRGDIIAETISVERGAKLEGKISIGSATALNEGKALPPKKEEEDEGKSSDA